MTKTLLPAPGKWTRIDRFLEALQAAGRYSFALAEARQGLDVSPVALQAAIRRQKSRGHIASPRRGYFIVVPPEYRSTGSTPPSWFIDDLMRFLGRPYYVGLLSAAALHGAGHQQPMVFQVVTVLPTDPITVGRVRIQFVRRREMDDAATTRVKTSTGYMSVSTPETTAFDLVRHYALAGHLSNVATVFGELADVIDCGKLIQAAKRASLAEVRRAGYLFMISGRNEIADCLDTFLVTRRARPSVLRPDASADQAILDRRWSLLINEDVEPDL